VAGRVLLLLKWRPFSLSEALNRLQSTRCALNGPLCARWLTKCPPPSQLSGAAKGPYRDVVAVRCRSGPFGCRSCSGNGHLLLRHSFALHTALAEAVACLRVVRTFVRSRLARFQIAVGTLLSDSAFECALESKCLASCWRRVVYRTNRKTNIRCRAIAPKHFLDSRRGNSSHRLRCHSASSSADSLQSAECSRRFGRHVHW